MLSLRTKDLLALTHSGDEYEKYMGAVIPPVFMNSLHVFESFEEYSSVDAFEGDSYVYGRLANPTVRIAERKIAELEAAIRSETSLIILESPRYLRLLRN